MENVRERVDVKLITEEKKLKKYVAKPSFKRFKIFNENLVGVEMKRVAVELNRPSYLGAQILDVSKNLMTSFHHQIMKPMYGDNIELLFIDTDSLCYEITTDDVYEDIKTIHDYFDTSNYDSSHDLYSNKFKKIPGKFKDELGGNVMKEFIGLRPKMYSIIYEEKKKKLKQMDSEEVELEVEEVVKMTTKGITKTARDKQLKHEHFRNCLFHNQTTSHDMKVIRNENHQLYLNNIKKKGLCNFDDKRYWNEIRSLAFGHYKINNIQ